jgi:Secretion system C-terminal sorting domain
MIKSKNKFIHRNIVFLNKHTIIMKNFYILSMLFIATLSGNSQITPVTYRGAFAPAPTAMWTDSWTNFDPQNAIYPLPTTSNVVPVTANITSNTTWTSGNVYYLKTQVFVKNNAILTIEAGTIILGDSSVLGASIFVTKGAKINAIGTATSPIVFTSDKPVGSRNKGDWGGIILLGKGSYNINGGVNNIEGIAASADTEFGGGATPDDNDSSGTLKYVRIEFGGYVFIANKEINGLTMGGVGRGTTIDYVQCSFTNDDSFEWFGGAVNCAHLVAYRGLDDDFDTDNGFSGKIQFCLSVRDPQISDTAVSTNSSNGFESDNNEPSSSVSPYTECVFSNVTIIGPHFRQTLPFGGTLSTNFGRAAHIRRNSKQKIFNTIFMDYNNGLNVDGVTTETNALNDELKFKNNIMIANSANRVAYVNATGNNPAFNVATWYAANNNTTVATNANILTLPYNLTDAQIYTGLDYRPTATSIAATGASFTDSSLPTNSFSDNETVSMSVYPNPFSNNFKINFESLSTDKVILSLYDITGRMVDSKNIEYLNINNQEIGSNLNSGVYIVNIKQGDVSKSLRIIKK